MKDPLREGVQDVTRPSGQHGRPSPIHLGPGRGAAAAGLAGCADDGPDVALASQQSGTAGDAAGSGPSPSAPVVEAFDERSDSILPEFTSVADLSPADSAEVRMTYAPMVPTVADRADQRIVDFAIDVIEGECVLDPANNVSTMMWGFRIGGDDVECGSPGPVMRARVGDLARITVTNLAGNANPHNIDFHTVTGQGGGAEATTVAPGESATINCRLLYPGAFMYHCAFGDVPMHISHGMYGMFIVDPETPLPAVDHEWSIMQSEWYLSDASTTALADYDPDRLLLRAPDVPDVQRAHGRADRRQRVADGGGSTRPHLHGERGTQPDLELPSDRVPLGRRVPGGRDPTLRTV